MLLTETLKLFWFCGQINYLHVYVISRDIKIVLILFQIWSWLQGDVNVRTSRTLSVIFVDASRFICQRRNITSFVRWAYKAYFGLALGDQDKKWVPHIVCHICKEMLREWTKGKCKSLTFGIPMTWREPTDHTADCCFCLVNTKGTLRHNLIS